MRRSSCTCIHTHLIEPELSMIQMRRGNSSSDSSIASWIPSGSPDCARYSAQPNTRAVRRVPAQSMRPHKCDRTSTFLQRDGAASRLRNRRLAPHWRGRAHVWRIRGRRLIRSDGRVRRRRRVSPAHVPRGSVGRIHLWICFFFPVGKKHAFRS